MPKQNKRTGKKGTRKRKPKKKTELEGEREKKKKKYNLATTHPSVTGQTPKCKPQERWIGVTGITGGRPAFYQNTFSFGGQMGTGVLELLGGEVRNRCVRSGPDSYSVIGETNTQPPGCKASA